MLNFSSTPPPWQPGLDALRALPDGAAALLVGATDRGKTTFAALAAQMLARDGGRIAVVDADIGQSEIGPPGTVGVAWADANQTRLHELKVAARFWVGAWAPAGVAMEHVVATGLATAWARRAGAQRLLIDTTGFVTGPAARRLKVAKAQLVAPALILGFARAGELDPLLAVLARATGAPVLVLAVPDVVGRKSTSLRTTRRLTRVSEALENAREITLPLASLATVGATLGTGEPLAPHLVRWTASALRVPVVYAERTPETISVFVQGRAQRPGWEADAGPVAEHFGVRTVHALSLGAHSGLYLGLHDEQGRLLSVGRFVRLETDRLELVISAPPPATVERTRLVCFGRVRLKPDGGGSTDVKPGEI